MTLAEKILAAHTDRDKVNPGEFVNVRVDMVLANDITAPIAIKEFRKLGVDKVFDPAKIVMVADHFVPNKDIISAENAKLMREFCHEQGTIHFDVGQMGIEHALLPEQGHIRPGEVGRSHPTPATSEFMYWHSCQVPENESPGFTISPEMTRSKPQGVKAQLPQSSGQVSPNATPVTP